MNNIKKQINQLLKNNDNSFVKIVNSILKNKLNKELKEAILLTTCFLDNYPKVTMRERIHCILYDLKDRPFCKNCNNKVTYKSGNYQEYCSSQCVGIYNKDKIGRANKKNNIERGNEIKDKRKETVFKRYGVNNIGQSIEIKKQIKNTLKTKTGYEYALQNPDSQKKYKQTCLERYGVTNISKTKQFKEKCKITCLKNYGVTSPLKNKIIKQKFQNTMYRKYKVLNPCQLSRKTYSQISQKLFWDIYDKLPNELKSKTYFAELNKEFDIFVGSRKQYLYDFVISNIKICIEFNGDFWHANPLYYKQYEMHPYLHCFNNEIWKKDELKLEYLQNKYFDILVIWDSEYEKNKDAILKKCLNFINNKLEAKI